MLMGSLVMEEKQLDFNRPLISVRRPTQTSETENKARSSDSVTNKKIPPPSPPVYKSDIKSGPVRNPGTVPFQWEHKPGKPKDESKPDSKGFVESHFVPKLPPGRKELGRKLEIRGNHQVKTGGDNVEEDVMSSNVRYYDDDDSESAYLDAMNALSRSESFFYNCSNVSGLDGPGLLVKPFGTLSSDRQTQDLMMGRFLPAAKALTSETTPPHLTRKPPKPDESPRQAMKKVVVVKEKQNKVVQNPYRFRNSPDQDEEDDSMMASGVCGLVPQICLKSSFGVLNSVPSVRTQAQRAVSVRRMRSKYQDSTACNEKQNKQTNDTVTEDKRKLKINESATQGNEKLEKSCTSTTSRAQGSKNFGELLASDDNTWEPVAEKTLYVDTVHSVDKKVQEETKEQSLQDYLTQDAVPVKDGASEESISQPKSTENTKVKRDEDVLENVEECPNQAIVALPGSNAIGVTKEKMNLEVKSQSITTKRSSYHIVPPPPLPKAPSDSWLKRTLPTIPSKNNSFLWLQSLGTEDDHYNKIHTNPKWETMVKTMVKTSNTQQGFVCFSKETLNPIPEA